MLVACRLFVIAESDLGGLGVASTTDLFVTSGFGGRLEVSGVASLFVFSDGVFVGSEGFTISVPLRGCGDAGEDFVAR